MKLTLPDMPVGGRAFPKLMDKESYAERVGENALRFVGWWPSSALLYWTKEAQRLGWSYDHKPLKGVYD